MKGRGDTFLVKKDDKGKGVGVRVVRGKSSVRIGNQGLKKKKIKIKSFFNLKTYISYDLIILHPPFSRK